MKIKELSGAVRAEFSPKDYWLRKNNNHPEWLGEYCLTYRIDMSYKGKDDQEGGVRMYLSEDEAEDFRLAGFDEISGGVDPSAMI